MYLGCILILLCPFASKYQRTLLCNVFYKNQIVYFVFKRTGVTSWYQSQGLSELGPYGIIF